MLEATYVITVRKVTTVWQTETHETILGLDQGSKGSKAMGETMSMWESLREIVVFTSQSKR